jgi:hypothetical protein
MFSLFILYDMHRGGALSDLTAGMLLNDTRWLLFELQAC